MKRSDNPFNPLAQTGAMRPKRETRLLALEVICQIVGVLAAITERGLVGVSRLLYAELIFVVLLSMTFLSCSLYFRFKWSRTRVTFLRSEWVSVLFSGIWVVGTICILLFGPLIERTALHYTRWEVFVALSEILIILRGVTAIIVAARRAAAGGINPALILVGSFLVLICVGTFLLSMPRARNFEHRTRNAQGENVKKESAPFVTAMFTATSASCVTGLVVEPTGSYWSRTGQTIILLLFQIGGLGIMTCGAFFTIAVGRHIPIREHATLRDILETDRLGDVRRLIYAILAFTFLAEVLGAISISGLWSELPFWDQTFYSIFHSVSAYCNAGFSLTGKSFMGLGHRWQVWGVVPVLIIIGGLGFAVLYNVAVVVKSRISNVRFQPLFNLPKQRVSLTLTAKLVLITTASLLVGGAVVYYLLESTALVTNKSMAERISESWFQAVTFRTAGFNTVDHGQLQPATKLFAIMLMFIGASPGSTGGGVKTVCFAVAILAIVSELSGRERVEFMGRTIPSALVNRALTIMFLGMMVTMTTTILLVLFERKPEAFLDMMYEATSAFATVGVSAGITSQLTDASKIVIAVTMFLGRVGPLTLLLAMSGRTKEISYEYPIERVTLG